MNDEKFRQDTEPGWGHSRRRNAAGRIWAGLFLLVAGVLLLLERSGSIQFPSWVFDWPGILMAIGLFLGLRHGFRGGMWLILIFIGAMGVISKTTNWNLENYIFPILVMAIGLIFLFKPRSAYYRSCRRRGGWQELPSKESRLESFSGPANPGDARDFIDVTAVFGGVKKNVLTKNFRGGDIVSFMGGSEIDLTQADFTGKIRVDVTNIFGGTKLIVPASWDVQNDITAVFGGVDDKRQISGVNMDPEKVLILDGTCLFGGIEIRNY